MVELFLDRLQPGRSELDLDDELVREPAVVQGQSVPGVRARVRGTLQVDAMDQKVLVHGEFEAWREMACDLCGEPFEMAYPAEVEILVLRSPGRGERDEEGGDDDAWVIQQSGGVVDLDDALLEGVVLDEPQRVVSEDHDHTELAGRDAGVEDEIDPRWEALRRLRDEEGEAGESS